VGMSLPGWVGARGRPLPLVSVPQASWGVQGSPKCSVTYHLWVSMSHPSKWANTHTHPPSSSELSRSSEEEWGRHAKDDKDLENSPDRSIFVIFFF